MKLLVAMRHSDIIPEHGCNGELIQQNEEPVYVYIAWCSGCGTEFRYEPDSDWITFVLPGMRGSLKIRTSTLPLGLCSFRASPCEPGQSLTEAMPDVC
jgi:hypothetical protein